MNREKILKLLKIAKKADVTLVEMGLLEDIEKELIETQKNAGEIKNEQEV